MIAFRNYSVFLALFSINIVSAMIPGASYRVYEGSHKNVWGYESWGAKYRNYYTFDGNLIKKVEHDFHGESNLFDPASPKPQPVTYEITYNPGIQAPIFWGLFRLGLTPTGLIILFYDKNGNIIKWGWCDGYPNGPEVMGARPNEKQLAWMNEKFGDKLDLSIVKSKLRMLVKVPQKTQGWPKKI